MGGQRPAGVLFDLDGTLTDRHSSVASYVRQLAGDLGGPLSGLGLTALTDRVFELNGSGYGRGRLTELAALGVWRSPGPSGQQLLDHWDAYFPEHSVLADGALGLLERLRAAGCALGLVTNGKSQVQRAKIKALAIGDLFSAIVISEEAGVAKPDPAIFGQACGSLGMPADRCIFVGDHPINDVQGARDAGLSAIWFASDPNPWEDAIDAPISSIRELERLLEVAAT